MENQVVTRWRKPRRVADRDRKRATRAPTNNTDLEQRLSCLERILAQYTSVLNMDLPALQDLAESLDKPEAPTSPVTPRSMGSGSEMIIDEGFTVFPFAKNSVLYSGEFSHWNFSMRIKQWIENSVTNKEAHGSIKDSKHKEYYRPEELQSTSNIANWLASFPPRYVAEFLIQTYFTYAAANYFYVERTWLMEKLEMVYQRPNTLLQRDVGIICIFFTIFAIGTQYAHLESRDERVTEQLDNNLNRDDSSEDTIGLMFYQQACRLIPDVITIASLESVQACLLIGLYLLPLDASGLSYIYLNLSLKLAIQNGMHRKCPEGALDPAHREVRNRVWWTVYTIEKRIGVFHGRPASISIMDFDAEMPTDLPEVSHGNQANFYSNMLATFQLNQMLGSIAREISLLRTRVRQEGAEPLTKLVGLNIKLQAWWEKLKSKSPQGDTDRSSTTVSRPDMHLKLEYCLVRMFTGRPFLFPGEANKDNRSNASPGSNQNSPPCPSPAPSHKTEARSILAASSVEAALSVIDTCKTLRDSIGLARPSYTEFSSCRAALLVIIAQCLQEKTPRLQEALRRGMSMLREMAAGGKSARSEASLIEALERAIARLDYPADSEEGNDDKADYVNFKKWEMLWQRETPSHEASGSVGGSDAMALPYQMPGLPHGSSMPLRSQIIGDPAGMSLFGANGVSDSVLQPMDDAFPFFGFGSTLQAEEFPIIGGDDSIWQLDDI